LGERRSYSPLQKVRKSVSAALLLSSAPLDSASMPLLVTDQESAPRRFMNSLERYFSLITFAEYLVLHGFTRIQLLRSQHLIEPTTPSASSVDEKQQRAHHRSTGVTLMQWLESRPEIQHICDKLQHELYIAIDKHKQAMAGTSEKQVAQLLEPAHNQPAPPAAAPAKPLEDKEAQEIAIVIASRRGSVLCRESLLKSDHFPGCHKASLDVCITGAPNYRKVCCNTHTHTHKQMYLAIGLLIDIWMARSSWHCSTNIGNQSEVPETQVELFIHQFVGWNKIVLEWHVKIGIVV
jgi:hypothetical protein